MKKMQRVLALLCLFALFTTTISVPLAGAEERDLPISSDFNQLEGVFPNSIDESEQKLLEIIKELELSQGEVLGEEPLEEDLNTLSLRGSTVAGEYQLAGIGTVTVLVSGAIIINNVIWEAGSAMAKKVMDLIFPAKAEPVYKTDAEAKTAADKLGYTKVSERCGKVAIFSKDKKTKKGPDYISCDIDGHIGGAWKGGSSPKKICNETTRSGTYDKDLNRIGK
ncbi:toxin C-terminal domain-containing protein [Sporosarcina sp. SG10008]|uniref:toxin C-terminal domain-containing protein n=2 Tax=unclassified Sporosarcina TaxID=2647733 RepID=UPI0037DD15BD